MSIATDLVSDLAYRPPPHYAVVLFQHSYRRSNLTFIVQRALYKAKKRYQSDDGTLRIIRNKRAS